ncbi:MAG: hypothetical protein ABXS92_07310 [Sulfurimonas sp.]
MRSVRKQQQFVVFSFGTGGDVQDAPPKAKASKNNNCFAFASSEPKAMHTCVPLEAPWKRPRR